MAPGGDFNRVAKLAGRHPPRWDWCRRDSVFRPSPQTCGAMDVESCRGCCRRRRRRRQAENCSNSVPLVSTTVTAKSCGVSGVCHASDQERQFKSRSDLVLLVRHVEWAMVDGTPCFGCLTKMAPFPCLFCFDIVWFFHASDTSIVPDPSTTRYVNSISNGTKTRLVPSFLSVSTPRLSLYSAPSISSSFSCSPVA